MSSDEEFKMEIPNTLSSIRGTNNNLITEIQMCRFCGKIGSNGAFIRLHYPSEHQVVIKNIRRELLECWKVKFSPNDGFPKHICQSCYLEFDSYFCFRDNYLESQSTLCSIYEDMQEKEKQKSFCSRMEETQNKKITRDETHQRKMLHCITNDHNYLGSYENFLKISTDDGIEQKSWKIKLKTTNTNEYFERNDENFICEPESDYDRPQYDEELFSDTYQLSAEENGEELESDNSIKAEAIESQILFEDITVAHKNIENQHYMQFQADNENEETIESEDSIKEEVIESQSLLENITDSVEFAQKDIENQSITSDRNEYEEKHINTLNIIYPKQEQITYLVDFSPVNSENHINSVQQDEIIENQIQSKTEDVQTDSVGSYNDNFEHFHVVQETSVTQTKKIVKTQIQNEPDEQIIDAVEYEVVDFDNQLDGKSSLGSDSDKNLNVTIFVQDKTMETQMKSEIEKQILNLVETNKNDFENMDTIVSIPKSDTKEFILDNSSVTIFVKQEKTIKTNAQVKLNDQMKCTESDINNSENIAEVSIPTKFVEERKVKTPIQIKLDEPTVDSLKSEENNFKTYSTKSNSKEHSRNYKHLGNSTDFAKTEKKKRNPYRLPFSCKFCVSDPDLLSKEVCDKYPTEEALTEHFHTEHDPEFPYFCLICKKKFKQYTTCRRHVFYKHKKPNVVCEICGVESPAFKISEHMERCHTTGDYQCEICLKEFKNSSLAKFKYHQKWHNREQQLKCTFCNKSFVQQSHLQEHIMEQHTKDYKIKCEICGAGFSAQFKKYVHMAKMHGELKPLKCLYCDQRFLGYKLRVRHMIAFHDHIHNKNNEQSKCPICNKVFGNERGLSIHESIGCSGSTTYENTNKDMYACGVCPRQFKSKATLTRHYKFHTTEGRPYQCELCSLNYETKLDLLNHKCVQFPNKEVSVKEEPTFNETLTSIINLQDHNYSLKFSEDFIEDKKLFEDIQFLEIPEGNWISKIENSLDKSNNDTGVVLLNKPLQTDSNKFRCDEVLFSDSDEFDKDGIKDNTVPTQNTAYPTLLINETVKPPTKLNKMECTIKKQINKPIKKETTGTDDFAQDDFNFKELKKKTSNRVQLSKLPYLCKFCVYDSDLITEANQISYLSDEALKEHMRTQHDPQLPYSCLICKKNYKKYTACRRHVFYVHIKPKVLCEVCGAECNAMKISQHILRYHTIGDYTCEICQKEFKNTSLINFKYHQRWHDTTLHYKCDMCDKAFIQPAHLKVHKMEKHTKDFKIKCVKCCEGFSSQYKKNIHMTKMHGEIQPLKCLFCDQRFKSYEIRRRHMVAFHDGQTKDEKVKCPSCKNVFRSDIGLKCHQKNGCKGKLDFEDSTDKNFTCSICPRKFRNKPALTKHFKFHSTEGRPYPCDRCYLNFKTKLESLNHKCTQVGKYLDGYLN